MDDTSGVDWARRTGPAQEDVDAVRALLDLMENFADNDQRARYLLSSNWMRDRGALASQIAKNNAPKNAPSSLAVGS